MDMGPSLLTTDQNYICDGHVGELFVIERNNECTIDKGDT